MKKKEQKQKQMTINWLLKQTHLGMINIILHLPFEGNNL